MFVNVISVDFLLFLCVVQPRKEYAKLGSTANKVLSVILFAVRLALFALALGASGLSWVSILSVGIAGFPWLIDATDNVHPRTTSLIYILASTLSLAVSFANRWHLEAICLYSALTFRYDIIVSYHAFRKQFKQS